MQRFVRRAHGLLDGLAGDPDLRIGREKVNELRGLAMLVEAQKLLAMAGAEQALPVLAAAKAHYLRLLPGDPQGCLTRLDKIGRLLEQAQEWETAVSLYREIATRFPQTEHGRSALLRVAGLYENALYAPLEALEVYAQYAARYPAELSYRQLDIGQRMQRLGYTGVLDFQKRNRLKPDGIVGPATLARLRELEAAFDMISLRAYPGLEVCLPAAAEKAQAFPPVRSSADILRGEFVHTSMFRIARRLRSVGRHHDAIVANRLFLNLFPTKREADDALISIARLFRDNLLFEEALGAYRELMADFPDGDTTSLAYVEAAVCLENLSRWQQAAELYELYLRKFPNYDQVALCRTRLPLLERIQQYEDYIADNRDNPKVAEAQYQIGKILYAEFRNYTKAAVEFAAVAERHPEHVRAADGLFMAGTAHLRAENLPAARKVFGRLVSEYPDVRLADDAQFWIGHTYEYAARALGKLDRERIVLKRRSLDERARLLADLPLRRRYYPEAQEGPEVPQDLWGGDVLGVLASGSKRDHVNADLFRAIREYRKVVANFKLGDMAGNALLRVGIIYTEYLKDAAKGIEAYQELLARYPASREAMEALYGVGTYRFQNGHYDDAIAAYRQFIFNYPREPKVQDAMLAIAQCRARKKEWGKALDAYQSYLNKFPDGSDAEQAREQIAWIRMYHF
jgi:TolA-binding protein